MSRRHLDEITCDGCGLVKREVIDFGYQFRDSDLPLGWRKAGDKDLCPKCAPPDGRFRSVLPEAAP